MEEQGKRGRLSPALVISIIALFVALGGGAYAAKVAKNSVSSAALKKNAVTETKIKAGAVTEAKLADGAATTAKLGTAWARVNASGVIVASQNITGISKTLTGRYCVDVAFTPNAAVATARGDGSPAKRLMQVTIPIGGGCTSGDLVVFGIESDTGSIEDAGFHLIVN